MRTFNNLLYATADTVFRYVDKRLLSTQEYFDRVFLGLEHETDPDQDQAWERAITFSLAGDTGTHDSSSAYITNLAKM